MSELRILIAEDDDGHALLIRETLERAGIYNTITRFKDGQSLWDFLTDSRDSDGINGKNYLVLLDINMPRMSGVEVLKSMKMDNKLKKIPVMILTTTDDPREVENCYELGCSCYITKPIDFNEFVNTLSRLGLFIQVIKV